MRLSATSTSCWAFWQSRSSSVQCFHWARSYWGRLTGTEAMVTCSAAALGAAMSVGVGVGALVGVVGSGAAVGSD